MGKAFRGVYHLIDDKVQLFDPHGDKGTAAIVDGLDNPELTASSAARRMS